MEQTGPTIQQVITQITTTVAAVSAFTTLLSLGITEYAKKFTNSSKVVAVFALVFGFLAGITIMHLTGQTWFSPMSLLVAFTASIAAPGVYSVSSTLLKKKDEQTA
jgi:uncharacterized membrane protein